jgi:hypothetical protein
MPLFAGSPPISAWIAPRATEFPEAVSGQSGWLADCSPDRRMSRTRIVSRAVLATWLTLATRTSAPAADPPPGLPFDVTLTGSVGIPRGYVKVRENETAGTHLSLHGDLGIDTVEDVELGLAYHLTARDSFRLRGDAIFLYGTQRTEEEVVFNGATFAAGSDLQSRPEFFRVTALYERRLLDFANGGALAGDIGATYVLLTYKINGTLASNSVGHETKEDFLTQELPIPMLGVSYEQPLGERVRLVSSLLGGWLPEVDSLRSEGGTVKLQQSHVDFDLGFDYAFNEALSGGAGYRVSYFAQHETSHEDGNDFQLTQNLLTFHLIYRF